MDVPSLSPDYVDSIWRRYCENPAEVEPSWRHFFMGVAFAGGLSPTSSDSTLVVQQLIRAYRKWGHLAANLNPLKSSPNKPHQLDEAQFGFTPEDLDKPVPSCGVLDSHQVTLKELIQALQTIYCATMGIEYLDGPDLETETWFKQRIEAHLNRPQLSLKAKRRILAYLNQAELFERFIHTKYVGQKRFSLEGAESLIPTLAEMLYALCDLGADQVILGMSHRGRLNVLSNIMGKTNEEIFSEFEPNYVTGSVEGDGDVKYHKGFVADFQTPSHKNVHVTLVDNPSHLEAVGPVVQGLARANQDDLQDGFTRVVPVLIHGDAAFPGQGVVSETLNLSMLEGYRTGGTIHIVVNNQIGFTTNPSDARGTSYCTDVARQIMAPVFHVNGDDPEMVVHAIRIAAEFRQSFQRDVVIDLVCYRRHGHNEGDEPSFTQPDMVRLLKKLPSCRKVYVNQLIKRGDLDAQVARELEQEFAQQLEFALDKARSSVITPHKPLGNHLYRRMQEQSQPEEEPLDTRLPATDLESLAKHITQIPQQFKAHKKLQRLLKERYAMVSERQSIDWGMAEQLALASVISQGVPCRFSGQDVKRGTFSHRHAVWFDLEQGTEYCALKHIHGGSTRFDIYNSPLSEFAVLGFDFGYSLAKQKHLVLWEAQFGDFANGAQVIVDQFIASSESKWNLTSNLVMMLPHGYEGQGPEHSSGRLERFLQLCAERNMRVMNLTEPAQLFHALRQQALCETRKPLILMTPKSLLRHPQCVSSLQDFSDGVFRPVICDRADFSESPRLLVCSGKIYYDLAKRRDEVDQTMPILRLEQLYPLNESALSDLARQFDGLKQVVWVQEESENMGAWAHVRPYLERLFKTDVIYVGRDPSSSPAVGSLRVHLAEQEKIMRAAFEPELTGVVTV